MAKKSDSANLVIAISSSALFDLSESDRIFREKGLIMKPINGYGGNQIHLIKNKFNKKLITNFLKKNWSKLSCYRETQQILG